MRIITFQHKKVMETLNKEGVYRCTTISNFHKSTPNCYKVLADRLNIPNNCSPIFGWKDVLGEDLVIDIRTINRALDMTNFNPDIYILIDLEVPEGFYDLQDFYNFVDERCVEEGIDDTLTSMWDSVFTLYPKREIQATMPHLDSKWVKGIYTLEYETKIICEGYTREEIIGLHKIEEIKPMSLF